MPVLTSAARRAWGRGLFRPPWQIVRLPEDVAWRAYHYLGTAEDEDHRYVELGITGHLDPAGRPVVVTNYLHRPLFSPIQAALAPGGVLIYETFMLGNERFGKPSNPAFLLRPGELKAAFSSMEVLGCEEGEVREPKPAMVQRICAIRR